MLELGLGLGLGLRLGLGLGFGFIAGAHESSRKEPSHIRPLPAARRPHLVAALSRCAS